MMKVAFLVLLIVHNSDSVCPISSIELAIIEESSADIMWEIGFEEVQMLVQIIHGNKAFTTFLRLK